MTGLLLLFILVSLVDNVGTQQAGHTLRPDEQEVTEFEGRAGEDVDMTHPMQTTEKKIWKLVVIVTGCGVSVGILLGSAILSTKSTRQCVCLSSKANNTGKSKYGCVRSLNSGEYFPGGYDETYSIVTYKFINNE